MDDLDALRKSPIFAGISPADLDALLAIGVCESVPAGHVFLAANESNRAVFVIGAGSVRVERRVGEQDVPLATLGPGRTFGEMSFLDSSPTTATVRAAEPTQVMRIGKDAVDRLFAERPALYGRFFHNVALELKGRLELTNDLVASYVDISRALVEDASFRDYYSKL